MVAQVTVSNTDVASDASWPHLRYVMLLCLVDIRCGATEHAGSRSAYICTLSSLPIMRRTYIEKGLRFR